MIHWWDVKDCKVNGKSFVINKIKINITCIQLLIYIKGHKMFPVIILVWVAFLYNFYSRGRYVIFHLVPGELCIIHHLSCVCHISSSLFNTNFIFPSLQGKNWLPVEGETHEDVRHGAHSDRGMDLELWARQKCALIAIWVDKSQWRETPQK